MKRCHYCNLVATDIILKQRFPFLIVYWFAHAISLSEIVSVEVALYVCLNPCSLAISQKYVKEEQIFPVTEI